MVKNNLEGKSVQIFKGIICVSIGFLILASQTVNAGDECRGGACRADNLVEVCLLPPPVGIADSRGSSNARTSARTVKMQVVAANHLISAGAALDGACFQL
jgi:hypothetical protein